MTDRPCDISIVVPVYNIREAHLRRCLDSLTAQTLQSIEIILVDDGSQNGCGALCDACAAQDGRVLVLHRENRGVSAARNAGMGRARGRCLMFVDPDDWLEPDCCERALAALTQSRCSVVLFDCRVINEMTGQRSEPAASPSCVLDRSALRRFQLDMLADRESFLDGGVRLNVRSPWGMLLDAGHLQRQGLLFVEGLNKEQDTIFNLYLFENAGPVFHLGYAGYNYRLHGASVTYRYDPGITQTLRRVVREEEKFIECCHRNEPEYVRAMKLGAFHKLHNLERKYLFHRDSRLSVTECMALYRQYLDAVGINDFLAACTVRDLPTAGAKLRFLMRRGPLLRLYLHLKKIKYAAANAKAGKGTSHGANKSGGAR